MTIKIHHEDTKDTIWNSILSTFIFEIINFLILIWILQRLFYKPLLAVIDKRKQHIDQSLADAKKLHQEADELRSLYENRQKLWMQEKKAALRRTAPANRSRKKRSNGQAPCRT